MSLSTGKTLESSHASKQVDPIDASKPLTDEQILKLDSDPDLKKQWREGLLERVEMPPGTNQTSPDNNVYRIKGGPRAVREFIMKTTPTLIYGSEGAGLKNASLSSMQVPELLTVNMQRSPLGGSARPNGERANGLPLQIIPAQLQAECMGCPLVDFMQMFFIDFGTMTSVDNVYSITGYTHTIGAGKFNTSLKFTPNDAYGKYASFSSQIETAIRALNAPPARVPGQQDTNAGGINSRPQRPITRR